MASELLISLPYIKEQVDHADVIMIMVGTNDLLSKVYDFVPFLKEIIIEINKSYPLAEVIINSLLPMRVPELPYKIIDSVNGQIDDLSRQTGSCFLDIHSRFLNSDKQLFQEDGVHITDMAYELWSRTLLEHIAFLIEDD